MMSECLCFPQRLKKKKDLPFGPDGLSTLTQWDPILSHLFKFLFHLAACKQECGWKQTRLCRCADYPCTCAAVIDVFMVFPLSTVYRQSYLVVKIYLATSGTLTWRNKLVTSIFIPHTGNLASRPSNVPLIFFFSDRISCSGERVRGGRSFCRNVCILYGGWNYLITIPIRNVVQA